MTDMKRSRFGEEQIIGFIKQPEAGLPIKAWAQSHGVRHILIEPGRPMQNGYMGQVSPTEHRIRAKVASVARGAFRRSSDPGGPAWSPVSKVHEDAKGGRALPQTGSTLRASLNHLRAVNCGRAKSSWSSCARA